MSNVVRLEYAYGVCHKCKRVHCLRYLIHNDGLIHKPYEIKCVNCNSYFAKEDIFGSEEETAPKPQTNADRIQAMSDEELAEFLEKVGGCGPSFDKGYCTNVNGCPEGRNCWLDWLRQEATQ